MTEIEDLSARLLALETVVRQLLTHLAIRTEDPPRWVETAARSPCMRCMAIRRSLAIRMPAPGWSMRSTVFLARSRQWSRPIATKHPAR